VTDANLVAGRIPAEAAFGSLALDRSAARAALDRAGVTAEGVLAVVDANMERALRAVSIERGVDPGGLALVAFGGAGPLHACALAGALGMPVVVVPGRAGVLSAVGLLTAPRRRDLVRSWPTPDDHRDLEAALATLADRARALVAGGDGSGPGDSVEADVAGAVGAAGAARVVGAADVSLAPGAMDVEVTTALDCRYRGQSHELTVPSVAAFHDEHRRRNGYARPGDRVEVVALRAAAVRPPAVAADDLPPPIGAVAAPVAGPAVVAQPDCTVWVAEGWVARPGVAGALVLERTAGR
jgi:N-methylhydantoinase A/oxoprolinase/acetone carboxylase beta subunit